jgi:hypothetical protein
MGKQFQRLLNVASTSIIFFLPFFVSPAFLCVLCVKRFSLLQFRREGQKRDVARPLDGFAEPALVARAGAGHAAGQNLAAFLHKRLEHLDFLVVDEIHVLDAKTAYFLFAEILALSAAARAAWTTARSSRPSGAAAFAALSSSASSMSFGAARRSACVSPLRARSVTRAGTRAWCFM